MWTRLSIKIKVILVIFVFTVVGIGLLYGLTERTYQRSIHMLSLEAVHQAQESFSNLEKNDVRMLSAVLEALLANKDYKKFFMERDRAGLLLTVSPLFSHFKERYDITHWYFLDPPPESKCFLRVHNPGLFDDVIKRKTYLDAVQRRDFGVGKEVGKTAFALRVVHPMVDDNQNYIGYMELGEEINHFVNIIKKQNNIDLAVYIQKVSIDEAEWATMIKNNRLVNHWGDFKDRVMVSCTSENINLFAYLGAFEALPAEGQVIESKVDGRNVFVRGAFPLKDANQRVVGAVVVTKNLTAIYSAKKEILLAFVIIMIAIAILLSMILYWFVFRRVDKLIRYVNRMVGGDVKSTITIEAKDEIGNIESQLEQLRYLYIHMMQEIEDKERSGPDKK